MREQDEEEKAKEEVRGRQRVGRGESGNDNKGREGLVIHRRSRRWRGRQPERCCCQLFVIHHFLQQISQGIRSVCASRAARALSLSLRGVCRPAGHHDTHVGVSSSCLLCLRRKLILFFVCLFVCFCRTRCVYPAHVSPLADKPQNAGSEE